MPGLPIKQTSRPTTPTRLPVDMNLARTGSARAARGHWQEFECMGRSSRESAFTICQVHRHAGNTSNVSDKLNDLVLRERISSKKFRTEKI